MKLLIVSIAIIKLALGKLCPNSKFYNVQEARSLYTGEYKYFKSFYDFEVHKLFINGVKMESLEIESISEGNINFIENNKPIEPKPYYDANLVCNPALEKREKETVLKKHCLLEYITIEKKFLTKNQVKFTYDHVTYQHTDSEYWKLAEMTDEDVSALRLDECESRLKENLRQDKACKIINVAGVFQNFEINGVRFDTEDRSFSLNKMSVKDISLYLKDGVASLKKNNKELANYTSGPCYLLLEKMNEIIMQSRDVYSEGNQLSYFDLTVSKGGNPVLDDRTPTIGNLKLDPLLNIKLNGESKEFKSFRYQILENAAPDYEGTNVYLIFQDESGTVYAFRVKLYFKLCLENLKKQVYKLQSCSDFKNKWLLHYYKQVDLQTGVEEYLQGQFYALNFEHNGTVEEYRGNRKLNMISMYGLTYENEKEKNGFILRERKLMIKTIMGIK
jgi:hypothetical protein